MKYNLGWGHSVCVREAFLETYNGNPIQFDKSELLKFDYPDHSGDPDMVRITRDVIKRQIDKEYKHVFLVNGATGGCVIGMRAYAQQGYKKAHTRNPPYYIRYPRMIQSSGLVQVFESEEKTPGKSVVLLDLPSNPLGMTSDLFGAFKPFGVPTIIDGVYLNNVYMPKPILIPEHEIMIGSYSKLTGINGIRIGWIALNDDLLAARIKELIASEYCGLSTSSTEILKNALHKLNWGRFEQVAKWKLDMNREEFSLLEKFFDGATVSNIGMFFYGPMDKKAQEIFNKANITWTKGSAMGTNDGFARFNLGQNNEYTSNAVKAVLKADKIK